ncbi:MAG: hypothetical protein EOO43_03915 [Flavobacterium sp.]|nr:MAG: hypothetical protein EOO43_03915 [Flavobacterium sp.]
MPSLFLSGYIMKTFLTLACFILTLGQLYGQKKKCYCDKDSLMNNATVSCKTQILRNKSKLYWQYNCDKIWLTLENTKGQKVIIDEIPVGYYGYTYRLGFHLVKEFEKSILFRSGCPANGPCNYTIIDKNTGKKLDEFRQLICIDTHVTQEEKYQFDFIVYADSTYKKIIVNYPDTKYVLTIPFDFQRNNLTARIPEFQFHNMKKNGNILTLFYTTTDDNKLDLKINLKNKKYSH